MRDTAASLVVSAISISSLAALLIIGLDGLAAEGTPSGIRRSASYITSSSGNAGFSVLFVGGAVIAAYKKSVMAALALLPTLGLVFAPIAIGSTGDPYNEVFVPRGAIVSFLDKSASPRGRRCPEGWTEVDDLAGKVAVGAGWGIGADGKRLTRRTEGQIDGAEDHLLTIDEVPEHSHQAPVTAPTLLSNKEDDPVFAVGGRSRSSYEVGSTGTEGGGAAHNNMPPFRVVIFCSRD